MENSTFNSTESSNNEENNSQNTINKKKKKFKIPSSIVIIMIILLFIIFLSWVLQGQSVSYVDPTSETGETITTIVNPVGLFSIGNLLIEGFVSSIDVILYLFVLGWFLEILLKTRTLEEGVKSLMRGLNGKEILIVPLLFILFSFAGTAFGMQEETLALFIIIIPFFILAGFDKVTGLLVILLGTCTGLAASVVDPFSVASAYDAIPPIITTPSGTIFTISDGLWLRFTALIVFTTIGASYVTFYAWRVKKNSESSIVKEDLEEDLIWAKETFEYEVVMNEKINSKQKWGLFIFISIFIFMFFMLIPWGFTSADSTYNTWISWLMEGAFLPGHWGFGELITLFMIGSIILGLIFKMSVNEQVENFYKGAKDMLVVSIIIGVARSIPAALSSSQLDLFISVNIAQSLQDNLSALGWTYIVFFVFALFAIFIPSTTGLANAVIGIFASSAYGLFQANPDVLYQAIVATIFAYVVAVGLMNMITPTQAVVLASCERSRVKYTKILAPVGIYMGIITVVTLVLFFPATLLV